MVRHFQHFVAFPLFVIGGLSLPAAAQDSAGFAMVKSVVAQPASVAPGKKATVVVTVAVSSGFHINANKPDDEMSIPTVLTLDVPKGAGVTIGKPAYPAAQTIPVSYSPKPIKGYTETVVIRVPVTIAATAKPSSVKLSGTLRAQGCNATTCFPPQSFPIAATLAISGGKK